MDFSDFTPLAVVVLLIILTDRWVVRFYRVFKEQNERKELSDQQLMLIMMECAESLRTIKETFTPYPGEES